MAYRLDSTASDVATHRAAWSPAQAAEYAAHKDFLLLKLLSKHRGAFATRHDDWATSTGQACTMLPAHDTECGCP